MDTAGGDGAIESVISGTMSRSGECRRRDHQ